MDRTRESYGGFLPLELNPGVELFAKYEPDLMRFNSVKAAIFHVVKSLKYSKMYLPYYYCPSTIEAIREMGVTVEFYHIDSTLLPINVPDEKGTFVMIVDYFGVMDEKTDKLALSFSNADVILDKAHAFFSEPVKGDRIHCIYSAKKFLGIPDGAYLVSKLANVPQSMSFSDSYSQYLLVTYEKGTNAAYSMKKDSDSLIAANYDSMSSLALGLLKNVDYNRVEGQRKANYSCLHKYFKTVNELSLSGEYAAYVYPLLISGKGAYFKQKLVENKIFVSTLWTGKDLLAKGKENELNLAENCIFLPMDQRYNADDMDYIAEVVNSL